ncbi:MAG: biotin--[acetyl-CoA-carboxylase] ligase [Candidatus Omnitrophota bacterium]
MDDKILNIFRASNGEYISGEELSEKLKISRAAVWKHIEKLRDEGYDIAGETHLGYRLIGTPDRLIPEEISYRLGTKVIGRKIYSYDTTDSTMDIAHKLAQANSPEGTVIFSEGQSKGRGRMGRQWLSPKGKGIYLSLILRPKLAPAEASRITLMTAVAAVLAIRKVTDLPALIKWPNDIYINGRKVCGILTEMNAEIDTVKYVIIGMGVNVNSERDGLPKEATSIKNEAGNSICRVELAKELLRQIEEQYKLLDKKGFEGIMDKWRGFSYLFGKRIKVICRERELEGSALDIDSNGALIVRTDSGFTEKILAGDVLMVR